jgi:hypothetical protein
MQSNVALHWEPLPASGLSPPHTFEVGLHDPEKHWSSVEHGSAVLVRQVESLLRQNELEQSECALHNKPLALFGWQTGVSPSVEQ